MKCLRRMSSKVCTDRLQGSQQLQTVFAMYNQELNRYQVAPSYQKFRKMVRQHVDQTIRTRNFQTRNERIETEVLVNGQKGRKGSAERKVGDCSQWKANGQCSKADSCSFNHGSRSGQRARSSSSTSKAPSTRSESFGIERQKTVSKLFDMKVHGISM